MKNRVIQAAILACLVAMSAGCSDDADTGQRDSAAARAEVLLVVQNQNSPLDLLQSTEANSVTFGADDGDVILEATEVETNRTRNVAASDNGNDLLLDAEEVKVRFTDEDGDGAGTVTLLDGDEAELAREEDVVLSGTETALFKQAGPLTLEEKITATTSELLDGRWSALAAAAIDLAGRRTDNASAVQLALDQLLGDLQAELGSLEDLLAQADTDNPLPPGVNSRPTLYRSLEADGGFATDFDFDGLLGSDGRAELTQFFIGVGQELIDFAAGREFQRTFLPQFLEDVDGYQINLDVDGDLVRFRLNWSAVADLDIHVVTPSGTEIFYDNESAEGGILDLDNTAGGEGAVENVVFGIGAPGEYTAFAEYFDGTVPADFELTAYVDGRIIQRLQGTLQPPDPENLDGDLPRSDLVTIRIK